MYSEPIALALAIAVALRGEETFGDEIWWTNIDRTTENFVPGPWI
jgi:hypothetical protein